MTIEQAFLILIGVACAGTGWFANQLYQAVQKLKDDLKLLEVKIGTDYVRYDRLQDALKPITQALEEIKAALASKADK